MSPNQRFFIVSRGAGLPKPVKEMSFWISWNCHRFDWRLLELSDSPAGRSGDHRIEATGAALRSDAHPDVITGTGGDENGLTHRRIQSDDVCP